MTIWSLGLCYASLKYHSEQPTAQSSKPGEMLDREGFLNVTLLILI